jgi:hypothetical protein
MGTYQYKLSCLPGNFAVTKHSVGEAAVFAGSSG